MSHNQGVNLFPLSNTNHVPCFLVIPQPALIIPQPPLPYLASIHQNFAIMASIQPRANSSFNSPAQVPAGASLPISTGSQSDKGQEIQNTDAFLEVAFERGLSHKCLELQRSNITLIERNEELETKVLFYKDELTKAKEELERLKWRFSELTPAQDKEKSSSSRGNKKVRWADISEDEQVEVMKYSVMNHISPRVDADMQTTLEHSREITTQTEATSSTDESIQTESKHSADISVQTSSKRNRNNASVQTLLKESIDIGIQTEERLETTTEEANPSASITETCTNEESVVIEETSQLPDVKCSKPTRKKKAKKGKQKAVQNLHVTDEDFLDELPLPEAEEKIDETLDANQEKKESEKDIEPDFESLCQQAAEILSFNKKFAGFIDLFDVEAIADSDLIQSRHEQYSSLNMKYKPELEILRSAGDIDKFKIVFNIFKKEQEDNCIEFINDITIEYYHSFLQKLINEGKISSEEINNKDKILKFVPKKFPYAIDMVNKPDITEDNIDTLKDLLIDLKELIQMENKEVKDKKFRRKKLFARSTPVENSASQARNSAVRLRREYLTSHNYRSS